MGLKINNLTKIFGENTILSDFSYQFDNAGVYLIIGESGVGKTTLLRMIAGLDSDYTGSIENGGTNNVSFMFQEYRLFPTLSALKNAAISQRERNDALTQSLLSALGFKPEDMTKKPRELSGGMKQRVAFVRSLLKDSPILILDEPTKELDNDTVGIMLEMIRKEAMRRLVIIVTHDDISDKLPDAKTLKL